MPIQLDTLKKSLDALTEVLRVSEDEGQMSQLTYYHRIAIRAGVIKHFEITYELCWKLMARWLNNNVSSGIADGVTRRHLFRIAAESQLIQDVDVWMQYHEDRNMTTHNYSFERAEEVYRSAVEFVHDARKLLSVLEAQSN